MIATGHEWRSQASAPGRDVGEAPRGLCAHPLLRSTSAATATSPRWPASTTWPTAISRPWSARWRLSGRPSEVDTIFVGGGTPTRLDAPSLDRLLASIRRQFPLAPGGEWTVEANPGTLDAEKADVLAAGGVNRVSLGAQSFQPELLKALERNHSPRRGPRALDWIRPRFPLLVVRPDLRRPRLDPRALGGRPRDRPGARAGAPLLLRAGLREGDRALEAVEGRPRPRGRRGVGADDVRAHDRPARAGGAGDVRDLQLRTPRPRVAAQPRLLGQRRLLTASAWGRPGTSTGSGRSTPANSPPTCAGSRRASRPPARPRRSIPRPAPARRSS